MKARSIAKIPATHVDGVVQWLILQRPTATSGWFLIGSTDANDGHQWDSWFEEQAHAIRAAYEDYGVSEGDWHSA